MSFPKDFVWGAAAASYQIEGGAYDDGKGLSIWDVFTHTPGKIADKRNGDIACDHYHRYKEDVGLMKQIGLKAYRMSVSWPRVVPDGAGAVNAAGLDFYDRLIDELLASGVTPFVTLYHWDLPYAAYLRGGWLNRQCADWFAEYAAVVVRKLSDRVKNWITLNEPQVVLHYGHFSGEDAPGLKLPLREVLLAGHHLMLAHGKGVQAIRANSVQPCNVGWAPVGSCYIPATPSPADVQAAKDMTFGFRRDHPRMHAWFNDPVFRGRYPEGAEAYFGSDMPAVQPGDMNDISQKIDFLGLNCYTGTPVRAGVNGPEEVPYPPGQPITMFKWPVSGEILYWAPKFYYERYKTPIYITENGLSNPDWVSLDGKVHDPQRIDLLTRFLRSYGRAIDEGVDARGYFVWSIMDNFEWAHGFQQRFGLIHVDYVTQKRTLKDSAYWYKDVIASNGERL